MKRTSFFKSETELAAKVIDWLRETEWEIYQEVQIRQGGPIADIVAFRDPLIWIVECKRTYGLQVVRQAYIWTGQANYISIATEPTKFTSFDSIMLRGLGIGRLQVSSDIYEDVHPRFYRRRGSAVSQSLNEAHKYYAPAGNSESLRYTPWRSTCDAVANAVRQNPGLTMKELLASIVTHYGSTTTARTALVKWIRLGKIKDVEIEEGRPLRLWPKGQVPQAKLSIKDRQIAAFQKALETYPDRRTPLF